MQLFHWLRNSNCSWILMRGSHMLKKNNLPQLPIISGLHKRQPWWNGCYCTSVPWFEFVAKHVLLVWFALITHLLSIRSTTSWKMLINNKFKAQTLTGNPTGNYRSQLLASRALKMSSSFSKSARSIESRFVVKSVSGEGPWNLEYILLFVHSNIIIAMGG